MSYQETTVFHKHPCFTAPCEAMEKAVCPREVRKPVFNGAMICKCAKCNSFVEKVSTTGLKFYLL